MWLRREIQDISLDDTKSRDYVDVNDRGTAIDTTKQQQLEEIKGVLEDQVCFSLYLLKSKQNHAS